MSGLFTLKSPSILPPLRGSGTATAAAATQIMASAKGLESESVFQLVGRTANSLQNQIDDILNALRKPLPQPDSYGITDPTGRLIAWLGFRGIGNAENYGLTVFDLMGNLGAWVGVQTELPLAITATSNANPDVVTIAAHGYVNGDTILIQGATGDTNINGVRIVENVTANTFTMTDLNLVVIAGNAAYTGGGTAQRYYGGVYGQTFGFGGTGGFAGAKIRGFADGSVVIGGDLKIVNGTVTINIDSTNLIKVSDTAVGRFTQMTPSVFRLQKITDTFTYSQIYGFGFQSANGTAAGALNNGEIDFQSSGGALGRMADTSGNLQITLDAQGVLITVGGNAGQATSLIGAASIRVQNSGNTRFTQLSSGGQLTGVDLGGTFALSSSGGLQIAGSTVIDASLNFSGNSVIVNGTTRISATGVVTSFNGFTGSQIYVKSVNFGASTVTTGTITVAAGIVTNMT